VISRLPAAAAIRLWDHVLGLVSFPVFADLKRSLGAVRNYAASSSAETKLERRRTGISVAGERRNRRPDRR